MDAEIYKTLFIVILFLSGYIISFTCGYILCKNATSNKQNSKFKNFKVVNLDDDSNKSITAIKKDINSIPNQYTEDPIIVCKCGAAMTFDNKAQKYECKYCGYTREQTMAEVLNDFMMNR